jgi:hypothetical protein
MDHSYNVTKDGALTSDRLRQIVLDLRLARQVQENSAAAGIERSAPLSRPQIDPSHLAETLARVGLQHRSALAEGAFLNVWAAAGLGRKETRNTEVLAWWLDPRGSHGLGAAFLSPFLAHVLDQPPGENELSKAFVRTELQPHGDDADRIDIAIDLPSFMVWIEAKIDAGEGHRQMQRYGEAARRFEKPSRLVYLSRSPLLRGRPAVSCIAWRDLARIARMIAPSRTSFVKIVLEQYADHITNFGAP